jgi:hypothetical protein
MVDAVRLGMVAGALGATRRGLGTGTLDELERLPAHVTMKERTAIESRCDTEEASHWKVRTRPSRSTRDARSLRSFGPRMAHQTPTAVCRSRRRLDVEHGAAFVVVHIAQRFATETGPAIYADVELVKTRLEETVEKLCCACCTLRRVPSEGHRLARRSPGRSDTGRERRLSPAKVMQGIVVRCPPCAAPPS